MIRHIEGDLFKTDADIIGHCVNCLGSMGAGVAKIVARNYPEILRPYQDLCAKHRSNKSLLLGQAQLVPVTPHRSAPSVRVIANLFTQINVGTHTRQVDYEAVHNSLTTMREAIENLEVGFVTKVAMPRIGAGLAGGDWSKIQDIIKTTLSGAPFDVIIYSLPERSPRI